ncbi:MAG TPA: radical SAM protein [Candidatus Colwellbacteria bacterium]|nr:radical SAM protein [Candidatus Colwellbacteria bacterium]
MNKSAAATLKDYQGFLKNYPVDYFTSDLVSIINPPEEKPLSEIKKLWEDFLPTRKKGQTLNFYIHVPFCKKRCDYCCCHSKALEKTDDIGAYVKNLVEYSRYFKKVFEGVSFTNLYIGGGTPSVLSEAQLDYLLKNLFADFSFDNDGEKTCEMHPSSADLSKLAVLRKYGFNRVSFGVQSLDSAVLRKNNRGYQTLEKVRSAIWNARQLGFLKVNADLILGLYGDSQAAFVRSFSKLMEINPYSIFIYPLKIVPTYIKKDSYRGNFERHYQSTVDFFKKLQRLAEKEGYSAPYDPDVFLPMNDASAWAFEKIGEETGLKKSYRAKDYRKILGVFGLGRFSMSTIPSQISYQMMAPIDRKPAEYSCSARTYSPKMEMAERVVSSLCYNHYVDCLRFREDFKKDFFEVFDSALDNLEALKAVEIKNDRVYLLTRNPRKKAAYMMFFCDPDENVLRRIGERRNLASEEEWGKERGIGWLRRPRPGKRELKNQATLKSRLDRLCVPFEGKTAIIDGKATGVGKRSLRVLSKDGKNFEFLLTPQTAITEMFFDDKEESYEKSATLKEIRKGDPVSVTAVLGNKPQALIVRKITVVNWIDGKER